MEEKIFKSALWLSLNNSETESQYKKKRNKQIIRLMPYYSLFFLLLAIGATIVMSVYFEKEKNTLAFEIRAFAMYISCLFFLILSFVSFLFKNESIQMWVNYLIYFFTFLTHTNYRYAVTHFTSADASVYNLLVSVEMILRLTWIIFGLLGFCEMGILNFVTATVQWSIYFPIGYDSEDFMSYFFFRLVHSILLGFLTIFSYFYEKKDKTSFHYLYSFESKYDWFNNIFDNMNTGFLSLKGNKISYINNSFFQTIHKIGPIRDLIESDISETGVKRMVKAETGMLSF
jgi:hypothetical protein